MSRQGFADVMDFIAYDSPNSEEGFKQVYDDIEKAMELLRQIKASHGANVDYKAIGEVLTKWDMYDA